MHEHRPNLLFVMTDHQRADSIGMVQAGVEVTPNLNRLAARSVHFRRAYTTCPLCVPARTSLATGLYPTRTGVVYNDWKGRTATDHAPLHQLLADEGYDVGHIGVDHIRLRPGLRERVDFAEWAGTPEYVEYTKQVGVDSVEQPPAEVFKTAVRERVGEGLSERLYGNTRTWTVQHDARHFQDMYWCRRAADFVRRDHARPFALFLYLWAPHPPLRVPEPYASMFRPDALTLPSNVGLQGEGEPPGRRGGAAAQIARDVSIEAWRRAWGVHLGLVKLADDGIGQVLGALEEAGRTRDTVAVFTVDHGDQLGQHRMYQKMEMYEPAVRVPLICAVPGCLPRVFDTPVSHLDVMPTLCALLRIDPPEGLDGLSFAASVLNGDQPADRTVFLQYSGNPAVGDIRRAAVTKRWKYVYDPDDLPELYDLEEDPLEMRNLASRPDCVDLRRDLHAQLARWNTTRGDWVDYGA